MAGITMCAGVVYSGSDKREHYACQLRHECRRYTAKPSPQQSWFVTAPVNKETGECSELWRSLNYKGKYDEETDDKA